MNAREQGGGGVGEQLLVVVPDANVLIHGKALVDLPWAELGRSQIEVLFVPPVVRELDKLKTQSGRQNKIARQLSSEIRALIAAPGRRAEVRKTNPAVDKRIELGAVTEPFHPALRLDHADQALINYALWLRQEGNDVLLLTDDTICGTTAQEVGLSVHFLPEPWLRQPEPDESAKENARLKAEIQRLGAAEPKVELGFQNSEGDMLTELSQRLTRWPALTEVELDELMAEVQERCPQATSFERLKPRGTDAFVGRIERVSRLSSFQLRSVYEPATEQEIEAYKTEDYPNWLESVRSSLATLHYTLEARTEWPLIVATSANAGTRPAVESLLTIQARGAIALLNHDVDEEADDDEQADVRNSDFDLPSPPTPPRGRTKTIDPLGRYRGLDAHSFATAHQMPFHLPQISSPKPRDSDAFYWRIGRHDWVGTIELECASWRHGQHPLQFALKIRPEESVTTSAVIEITVHAHNITDPPVSRLPVRFEYEDGQTIEKARSLVDRLSRMAVL
jgi:hypothetical protein